MLVTWQLHLNLLKNRSQGDLHHLPESRATAPTLRWWRALTTCSPISIPSAIIRWPSTWCPQSNLWRSRSCRTPSARQVALRRLALRCHRLCRIPDTPYMGLPRHALRARLLSEIPLCKKGIVHIHESSPTLRFFAKPLLFAKMTIFAYGEFYNWQNLKWVSTKVPLLNFH